MHRTLDKLGDELRFVLITSYASLHELAAKPAEATVSDMEGLYLVARPTDYDKCVRCWHHREDVGSNPDHPELCGRCVENVEGAGESRRYA